MQDFDLRKITKSIMRFFLLYLTNQKKILYGFEIMCSLLTILNTLRNSKRHNSDRRRKLSELTFFDEYNSKIYMFMSKIMYTV